MRPDGDSHVQAGKLRHRVTINYLTASSPPVVDAAGPVMQWVVFQAGIPAQIGPVRSTDMLRNGQVTTETITPITIRYLPGVLPNMQVVSITGATYIIQGILNIDERNILLDLNCLLLGNQT